MTATATKRNRKAAPAAVLYDCASRGLANSREDIIIYGPGQRVVGWTHRLGAGERCVEIMNAECDGTPASEARVRDRIESETEGRITWY